MVSAVTRICGGIFKSQNGLGLGLYVASEIAKARNGTLTVTSNEQQTCFTFRAHLLKTTMPYK